VRSLAPLLVLAAGGLSGLAGCVNTDANIFVAPTVTSPAAKLTSSGLPGFGVGITGSFDLGLDLSPRASGPSTVELVQVSILDATMTTPIVQALSTTSTPAFPTTVQPGDDPTINITLEPGSKTLPQTDEAPLCAAAGVVFAAQIQDSLLPGTSKTAYSPVFHVGGCM